MPDRGRVVVSNTTPIITLSLIGKLDLMRDLYGEVLIPPAVYTEILVGGKNRSGIADLQAAEWIRVQPLVDPRRALLLPDLDLGEAEAITLAMDIDADLLLMDERLGRRYAQRVGLVITGSVGILLEAKEMGKVDQLGPLIDQLRAEGIRLSDELVDEALKLANEQ